MPGGGGGPYPPPKQAAVPTAHAVADPVESLYPNSPYVPGTVVVAEPTASSAVGSYVPPDMPSYQQGGGPQQQQGGAVMGQPVGRFPQHQQQALQPGQEVRERVRRSGWVGRWGGKLQQQRLKRCMGR